MRKESYLSILQTKLQEFIEEITYPEEELFFQQYGDPKHAAKIVQNRLSHQHFQLIKWPPQSPALNPKENIWAVIKR